MTAKQLIEKLQELDPEVRMVVRGYEGGVDDIVRLEHTVLKLNANTSWYYGRHEPDILKGTEAAVELVGGDQV